MIIRDNELYTIFSIDFEHDSATRYKFAQWLASKSIGFRQLNGCYNDVTEHSFIIKASDWPKIERSGFIDYQESILLLGAEQSNGRRKASLKFLAIDVDNIANIPAKTLDLGELGEVSKEEALTHESYSYFRGDIDKYFVAKLNWDLPVNIPAFMPPQASHQPAYA